MTRPGKCDVCRKRKVKCDEVEPTCGACKKSRRSCSYVVAKRQFSAFVHVLPTAETGGRDSTASTASPTPSVSRACTPPPFHATLTLRKATRAESGNGVFREFTSSSKRDAKQDPRKDRKRDQDPEMLIAESRLNGKTTNLVLRWRYLCKTVAPGEQTPHIIGEWLDIIPLRIGLSAMVDTALDCLISSVIAYMARNEYHFAQTCALNARALSDVRTTLATATSRAAEDDALLAINFLYAAEIFRGVDTLNYKIHMRGRDELLAKTSKQGTSCTEMSKQAFFSTAGSDLMSSIMANKNSIHDTPAWLGMRVPRLLKPEYPEAERVDEYRARGFIRIPRLVRLTRLARQNTSDEEACNEAYSLATDLYCNTLEDWVQQIQDMQLVRTVPTIETSCASMFSTSFKFSSARLFVRLTKYWRLRCIISGCMLALLDTVPPLPHLINVLNPTMIDKASVYKHEQHAAQCIARSVPWATQVPCALPIYEIYLIAPLMNAYAVWMRMERRQRDQNNKHEQETPPRSEDLLSTELYGFEQISDARRLQLWAVEMVNIAGMKFNAPSVSEETLRFMDGVLTGGALPGPPI